MISCHNCDIWINALTLGYPTNYYNGTLIDIGEQSFNNLFQNTQLNEPIIRRQCSSCIDTHKDIYYKRYTNINTFNAYSAMKNWQSINNTISIDFNLFSSLQDALTDTNPWTYCNFDDAVGAFRDCGQSSLVPLQWTADTNIYASSAAKPALFSIYNGSGIAGMEC